MPEFNVRSDSVNVEQIMEQIRARIREKRGVDYTEQQIRELAAVKLEKFLDPRGVRSDLLERFRTVMPANEPLLLPNYRFEEETLFESHRGFIRFFRRLFRPLLKLFFNPNPLIQALNIQARLNTMNAQHESSRRGLDQLYYELIHNLVVEVTRTGIDVKNLKMHVESLASRLEFNERRARALESAVVYKPSDAEPQAQSQPTVTPRPSPLAFTPTPATTPQPSGPPTQSQSGPHAFSPQGGVLAEGPGQRSRRRRRRRGRRGGSAAGQLGPVSAAPASDAASVGQAGPSGAAGLPGSDVASPASDAASARPAGDASAEQAADEKAFEEFEDEGGPSGPEPGSEPGAQ
jgi:hypothetical protein